ncbi:unnamed protein product, partial [Sphacelaria rigidula]
MPNVMVLGGVVVTANPWIMMAPSTRAANGAVGVRLPCAQLFSTASPTDGPSVSDTLSRTRMMRGHDGGRYRGGCDKGGPRGRGRGNGQRPFGDGRAGGRGHRGVGRGGRQAGGW